MIRFIAFVAWIALLAGIAGNILGLASHLAFNMALMGAAILMGLFFFALLKNKT